MEKEEEKPENDIPVSAAEPSVEPPSPTPDYEKLIREAYLRGRNEAIDELMRRPAMMQPLGTAPVPDSAARNPDSEVMILNSLRSSIWDK